jgi:putative tricarboxylic transport membrane protein
MTDLSLRDHGPSQRLAEFGVAAAILLFGALTVFGAVKAGIGWGPEGPRAGFFPFYVGLFILGASIVNLLRATSVPTATRFADWDQLRQVSAVIVPTAVYVSLVPWIGFYVSSMILIAVFMRWIGHYGWGLVALVAVGVPVGAYVLFEMWFLVPLPKGPFEEMVGL